MKIRSLLLVSIAFTFLSSESKAEALAASKSIDGTVTIDSKAAKGLPDGGALFVIAKSTGQSAGAPIAVLRIPSPKFPQKFSLTERNVMMPGTPFKGPLKLTARFSPSGDALDKTGPEGVDNEKSPVDVGSQGVKIELKTRSK